MGLSYSRIKFRLTFPDKKSTPLDQISYDIVDFGTAHGSSEITSLKCARSDLLYIGKYEWFRPWTDNSFTNEIVEILRRTLKIVILRHRYHDGNYTVPEKITVFHLNDQVYGFYHKFLYIDQPEKETTRASILSLSFRVFGKYDVFLDELSERAAKLSEKASKNEQKLMAFVDTPFCRRLSKPMIRNMLKHHHMHTEEDQDRSTRV